MSSTKIQVTKNYRLFSRSGDNRETDLRKHKRLAASMRKYGFLKEFPIVCFRDKKGNLLVKDGQHRLTIAEQLGLPVYWVEQSTDWNTAEVNTTPVKWSIRDHAEMRLNSGLGDYGVGLEFHKKHGIPIGMAFALLAGVTGFTAIEQKFLDGEFKVKERALAELTATVYKSVAALSAHNLCTNAFIGACVGVCRVKEFDPKRLIGGAERCRDLLVPLSNREAYIDLLDKVYNFGRKQLVGLRVAALMAMRERNPARQKADAKHRREGGEENKAA